MKNEGKKSGLNVSPFFLFLFGFFFVVVVKQHKRDSYTTVLEYNELILWNQSSEGSVIIFKLPAKIPKYDN